MNDDFYTIPDDYLVPIDYPEGDKHLSALNNIQFAHSEKFDLNSMTFFSEATYLIANAIKLYRSGYFDCAFYSLRQSIELSIGILYLTERGAEYLRKWECQEDGFETGSMSNYLRKHTHIFSDIRTKMAEFSNADLIKLRARKGQSVKNNAICMVLNRWKTNRKIEQIAEAKYKKL